MTPAREAFLDSKVSGKIFDLVQDSVSRLIDLEEEVNIEYDLYEEDSEELSKLIFKKFFSLLEDHRKALSR